MRAGRRCLALIYMEVERLPDHRDLLRVCGAVLDAAHAGKARVTINNVVFDDLRWDARAGGRCQENARKVYEAATGRPMPGKACCAYRTNLNLYALHNAGNAQGVVEVVPNVEAGGQPEQALPGDYLYFRGTPRCSTCGVGVGHVGIWMGDGRMFQHTSRAGLAITDAGPTWSQRRRFCGAYRLLPRVEEGQPLPAAYTGRWRIEVLSDLTDIVARGRGTTWTDHRTRTGVPADTPGLIACSLPRGYCSVTEGSPFEGVPDFTVVKIYYAKTGKLVYAPVIDEGPSWEAMAGTGKPGSAMIDLTPAAWEALGGQPNTNDTLDIRVLKGSHELGHDAVRNLLARS